MRVRGRMRACVCVYEFVVDNIIYGMFLLQKGK